MKILFLHLSDAHFKENTKYSEININAMVKSLSQMEHFEECIIVFSGDVVQSGEDNQYKKAGGFLGILIKGIREKYLPDKIIQTLITPGNHDNLAKNPNRNIEEIKEYYNSKETDSRFYEELSQLENFYKFANRNYSFTKGKVIDVKKLIFGKFIIKVNLINSAPFSLLGNGNEDKGLHYLPESQISNLDFERQENYTISVIHHSPEWFSDKSKQKLYNKMYETSDLIFVGHEHFSLSENKTVNNKYKVDISSGVALNGTNTEHGFNAMILDTDQHYLCGNKFIYNGNIYKPSPNLANNNVVFKGKYKFTPTQEFIDLLEYDKAEREKEKYLDYFVFPSLEAKNINDDLKNYDVTTEEKFIELLNIKNKISIEGSSKAGKTILSKYLCRSFLDDYVPIYLDVESFSPKDNQKIIKYALLNHYGEDVDFDQYMQLSKDKKVLIVDGYDKIRKELWKSFIDQVDENFGHIILFCDIDWNLNIKEKTLEELSENKIFYLKICPFYYAKREQLIKKICTNSQENRVQDVDEKTRKINEEITNQIKYFQLNPDFIHQFVDYYLNFSYTKTQKESNVFNKVFEANITFRLTKNTGEENIDEIFIALDFIAHYIHFNKRYPLPVKEFEMVVKQYNEKYDNELNAKFVYDMAIKSNIIREVPNKFGIEFCDENLLAYFTALHLNRIFNEGQGAEELKYILDNICFNINGDIILFLSYITSNIHILTPITNSIIAHMEEWEEMDIDNKNIEYLANVNVKFNTKLPGDKDKQKLKEQKGDMEKEIVENHKNDSESLYSYDETKINSFGNKISKSIKYLELVAKILPTFRHILTGEQKQSIVNILYTYPNKLLYFMLKDIDENYKSIIDEILACNPRTKKGESITKDIIIKELHNQSIAYILSIYDFIANTASTGKTISDLNKFIFNDNTNYKLQNIMMEENVGRFHIFAEKAEKLYDNASMNITKQMVALIVRKYFLCHEIPITGEAQHVIDKFFGESQKKAIIIAQAKNRIIKK